MKARPCGADTLVRAGFYIGAHTRKGVSAPHSFHLSLTNSTSAGGQTVLQKSYALHAGDLKALAATNVLADHHVVAAQHVGLRFGELCAVAIIGARRQTLFLRSHQPLDFVFGRLLAA